MWRRRLTTIQWVSLMEEERVVGKKEGKRREYYAYRERVKMQRYTKQEYTIHEWFLRQRRVSSVLLLHPWTGILMHRGATCSPIRQWCLEQTREKGLILTKGGKCWKLFTSDPSSENVSWSFNTKEISIILVTPAAIKVYPKTVWTIVDNGRCWGWADMA